MNAHLALLVLEVMLKSKIFLFFYAGVSRSKAGRGLKSLDSSATCALSAPSRVPSATGASKRPNATRARGTRGTRPGISLLLLENRHAPSLRFCRYDGDHLVFETSQTMNDIPYGDCFTVDKRWDIRPDPESSESLLVVRIERAGLRRSSSVTDLFLLPQQPQEVHLRVPFSRTCFFKKIIEMGTFGQSKEMVTQSVESINQAILDHYAMKSAVDPHNLAMRTIEGSASALKQSLSLRRNASSSYSLKGSHRDSRRQSKRPSIEGSISGHLPQSPRNLSIDGISNREVSPNRMRSTSTRPNASPLSSFQGHELHIGVPATPFLTPKPPLVRLTPALLWMLLGQGAVVTFVVVVCIIQLYFLFFVFRGQQSSGNRGGDREGALYRPSERLQRGRAPQSDEFDRSIWIQRLGQLQLDLRLLQAQIEVAVAELGAIAQGLSNPLLEDGTEKLAREL